jgi:UDP-2,3-diacylglucosamine hydrolase
MQLFISDLHLSADRPDKLALFQAFVARAKRVATTVYILGDLFEFWLGDDDDCPVHAAVVAALADLTRAGVAVQFMHGNRDFLCGDDFAAATGATFLPDYAVIGLAGHRAVLTHGDLLCTRDVKYQRFRRVVHNPLVQRAFLAAPLAWRRRIARGTRSQTLASTERKAEYIMDVDAATVAMVLREHRATLLIHGHTHRPAMHELEVDGRACRRVVIGDWYTQDDVIACSEGDLRSMRVTEFVA